MTKNKSEPKAPSPQWFFWAPASFFFIFFYFAVFQARLSRFQFLESDSKQLHT